MEHSNSFVWQDGGIRPQKATAVSPLDRAYLIGYGAFETLHSRSEKVVAVTRHWKRLCHSCEVLGIQAPSFEAFQAALHETLQANGLDNEGCQARLRCTVSPAVNGSKNKAFNMLVTAVPAQTSAPHEKLAIIDWPKNEHSPLAAVKCVSYAEHALAKQRVADRAGEGLWSNLAGDVCEGTTSNIFFVEQNTGVLMTPPLEAGCLPGVIRGLIIELAEKNGIPLRQQSIPARKFKHLVKEAFLTSSIRYVQPVSHIDGEPLPECPGEITKHISILLDKLIETNPDP